MDMISANLKPENITKNKDKLHSSNATSAVEFVVAMWHRIYVHNW